MTNRNRIRLSKLSLCLIAALAAAPVFAQSTSAGVSGSVTDAAGKPVVGADVTITHIESGSVSRATTDGSGRYNARGLRVGGPYTITITKAGSGTDTEDNVFLGLDRVAEVDAQLKNDVSTLATVSVVGSRIAETFEPNNKGLTTTLNLRDLKNAPMPNRSIQDVARLDPRVVITDQSRGEISALQQHQRGCRGRERPVRPRGQRPALRRHPDFDRHDPGIQHLHRQLRREHQSRRGREHQCGDQVRHQ
jgi:hypothetical protein